MIHPKLKPTKKFDIDFNPRELNDIEIPEESKKRAKEYLTSDNLSDEEGQDIMIMLEDSVMFGYDYLYNGKKVIIPEINPSTIFYSNALMSYGMLDHYKEILLSKTSEAGKTGDIVNLNHFGTFFQLAANCIVNLQATVESFLNSKIIGNYEFLDKSGKPRRATITDKMDIGIQVVTSKNFENQDEYTLITDLIKLRNNIIHLKPEQKTTNTKYKISFRKTLDFKYYETIVAVRNYVNFYEPNLIEECQCGKDFFYDIFDKSKKNKVLTFKAINFKSRKKRPR